MTATSRQLRNEARRFLDQACVVYISMAFAICILPICVRRFCSIGFRAYSDCSLRPQRAKTLFWNVDGWWPVHFPHPLFVQPREAIDTLEAIVLLQSMHPRRDSNPQSMD